MADSLPAQGLSALEDRVLGLDRAQQLGARVSEQGGYRAEQLVTSGSQSTLFLYQGGSQEGNGNHPGVIEEVRGRVVPDRRDVGTYCRSRREETSSHSSLEGADRNGPRHPDLFGGVVL